MTSIIAEKGKILTERIQILDRYMRFYKELYRKSIKVMDENNKSDEILTVNIIIKEERFNILKYMKKKTAQGEGDMVEEMSQERGDITCDWIVKVFNACLFQRKIPKAWCNTCMILSFKKGNNKNIKNHRSISLLSH